MFDLAARDWSVKPPTGELVGPTTYVLCNPKSRKQSCAPFLSTQKRVPVFVKKLETEAIYDVRNATEKIKGGGCSLRSKTRRLEYKVDDNPSPTKYNPFLRRKEKVKLDPNKPKLYACRVPHSLTVTAPSIPTENEENGYDIDERGDIVKVPRTKRTSPALDYRHLFVLDRGCAWAGRTELRFNDKVDFDHPGPTRYDVQMPKCKRYEADEEYREMARLFSFVPRYIEAQGMKARNEGLPGPGTYDVPPPSALLADAGRSSKGIKPRPFVSGVPRFQNITLATPSPNQYKIGDSPKRKQFSLKCSPFGFDSPRFRASTLQPTPGPAAYGLKGAIAEKVKKNRFALFHAPFNNTAYRTLDFTKLDAPCMPSPADYPEPSMVDEYAVEEGRVTASVFKSDVGRFPLKVDVLGPASYNISASFNKNRDRKSYHAGSLPFNSSGRRNTLPVQHLDVPCPTLYETELGLDEFGGHRFDATPRFPYEGDETPGPTTYKLHAAVKDSFYHAANTYNLRLKENVLGKKLRLAPKHTRNKYVSLLKRRKKLKHFDVELDYEERLMLLIDMLFSTPI